MVLAEEVVSSRPMGIDFSSVRLSRAPVAAVDIDGQSDADLISRLELTRSPIAIYLWFFYYY